MSNVQQVKRDEEVKTFADIEPRNLAKLKAQYSATQEKVDSIFNDPTKKKEAEENWKQKTYQENTRIPVGTAYEKAYPEATNPKIAELMRQLKAQ